MITRTCVWFGLSLIGSGAITWSAEVEAVAYADVIFRDGYELIADPLSDRANRVDQILPAAAEGTRLVKFDGRNWQTNEFLGGSWTVPDMTLSPGEAGLLRSAAGRVQTWVGSVLQGELKVLIPAGPSLRSSLVPQSGKLSEVLQFPKIVGTKISGVDNTTGQFVLRAACTEAGWQPEEPVLNVGEGFYVEAPQEFVWTRSFAVAGLSSTAVAIRITSQPQSRQINPGDTLSLSVEAASTNSLFYRWQRNGNDVPAAIGPTLVIPNAGVEDFGDYWVSIWDRKSWVWSEIARVQLTGSQPSLAISPDNQGRGVVLISQGTSGRKVTIQVSTDLVHWVDLGSAELIDANSVLDRWAGRSARFYRSRVD